MRNPGRHLGMSHTIMATSRTGYGDASSPPHSLEDVDPVLSPW